MLLSKDSVNKQFVDTTKATPAVFAALGKKVVVKVSPCMYGVQKGDPYHISFENGIHVPKNSMELFALRQRQRLVRDVVELNQEVLEIALEVLRKKKKTSREEPKKGGKK